MRRPVSHPDRDPAGAAGPAVSAAVTPQPEAVGDAGKNAGQEDSRVEHRELVDTLDVVPAVGAGAALGVKRTR